jgi:hypothetical protein
MTDKPILFSAPMVRALLAGTKTQTRRLMETPRFRALEHPVAGWRYEELRKIDGQTQVVGGGQLDIVTATPYLRISVGDRLYVREAWRAEAQDDRVAPHEMEARTVGYIADEPAGFISRTGRFRQGMHMPRWASRITLHVTEARVQRLQEISEEDAKAEGVDEATCYATMLSQHFDLDKMINPPLSGPHWPLGYRRLWESINGEGTWADNPWVAAYTFDVEICNIAEARK